MRWHPVWPARARASRCNPPHRGASAPRRSGRCPMWTGCSEPFAPCFRYASSRRRGIVRRVRLCCRPRRSSRFLREGSVAVRPTQDRRRCTPIQRGRSTEAARESRMFFSWVLLSVCFHMTKIHHRTAWRNIRILGKFNYFTDSAQSLPGAEQAFACGSGPRGGVRR